MSNHMIRLTGLWGNIDSNGTQYYSGSVGNIKYLIFANGYKTKNNHPDLYLYIAEAPTTSYPSHLEGDEDVQTHDTPHHP